MVAASEKSGIRVYSRRGCHLCEDLIDELLPLVRGRMPVEVVDIDTNPAWVEQFGTRIPVVEANGSFICQYTLDRERIARLVNDADSA